MSSPITPYFIRTRGGVSLRPGDGIFHSWVNRMLIPDTVSARGAGSGLVAFAAATGMMSLDISESVLIRFSGLDTTRYHTS